MATLQQIRTSILEQAEGHYPTDDSRYRFEFIENLIRSKRSYLLEREANRSLGVDLAWYTNIDCLEVKCGRVSCPGFSAEKSYSYVDMPNVESNRWAIAFLGTPAGDVYAESPIVNFLFGRDSKPEFPGNPYVLQKGRAIFRYQLTASFLRLVAILSDPSNIAEFPCIEDFETTAYPIPTSLVHELELLCLKQLLSTRVQPDDTNDATNRLVADKPQNV